MNKKTRLCTILSGSLFLTLYGCSTDNLPGDIDNSSDNIDGHTVDQIPAPAGTDEPDAAAAIPEAVATDTLVVDQSFSFNTSRMIDIAFDIESARNEEATVTICTEYFNNQEGFDINYDSCPVKGTLVGGVFNHSMEVTNAYDSVVAAVWFQSSQIQPIFREFTVAQSNRRKGPNRPVIVWRE